MEPLVTVAIPSFNQSDYLQEALNSIYEQSSVSVEICVADGGSTDGSKELIENNSNHLKWHQSKVDDGQSYAVNVCVKNGTAPYICWLNSDDLLMPNALSEMTQYLENHPDTPAVYGNAYHVDHNGVISGRYYTQLFSQNALAMRCIICQPAVLIRRSVWEQLGGLDESLNMSMDYDLWWRIYRKFGELDHIPNYVAKSRIHGATKTNSFRKLHYQESVGIVAKYRRLYLWYWYLKWTWSVWYKSLSNKFRYSN